MSLRAGSYRSSFAPDGPSNTIYLAGGHVRIIRPSARYVPLAERQASSAYGAQPTVQQVAPQYVPQGGTS